MRTWRRVTLVIGLTMLLGCSESQTNTAADSTTGGATAESAADDTAVSGLIGAYYYPWYGSDFHGGRYLRAHLQPRQRPLLGEYDDREDETIASHLDWSKRAGIGLWVTSWWGPESAVDATIRQVILPHPDLEPLRIAVLYETAGRTGGFNDMGAVEDDFAHLAEHYFSHPAYLRVDDRPVVFVYLTRVLEQMGHLEDAVARMRSGAAASGHMVYIVGDHAFGSLPPLNRFDTLDAITTYDVYGSMAASGVASIADVERHTSQSREWKNAAADHGVAFVPAITPGFNDSAVRSGHRPLSRRLPDGRPLLEALARAIEPLRDPSIDRLVMITSWNEWHEDTQIEPVAVAPATSHDDSAGGSAYTSGLSYEGYGTLYLEIIAEVLAGK